MPLLLVSPKTLNAFRAQHGGDHLFTEALPLLEKIINMVPCQVLPEKDLLGNIVA